MKKFKSIGIFILLIVVSSCLNYEQVTTINTDNTGRMYVHYWIKINFNADSILINKIGLFNKNVIKKEFTSKYSKIKKIEIYKDYADSTIHVKINLTFNNFDSLNQAPAFRGAQLSIKDGPGGTKIFSQYIPPISAGFGLDSNINIIKYIYYLPGEIQSDNANSLSRNRLTWVFTPKELKKGKIIKAKYIPFRLKETPKWVLILSFVVILIVLVFLFWKRKI